MSTGTGKEEGKTNANREFSQYESCSSGSDNGDNEKEKGNKDTDVMERPKKRVRFADDVQFEKTVEQNGDGDELDAQMARFERDIEQISSSSAGNNGDDDVDEDGKQQGQTDGDRGEEELDIVEMEELREERVQKEWEDRIGKLRQRLKVLKK